MTETCLVPLGRLAKSMFAVEDWPRVTWIWKQHRRNSSKIGSARILHLEETPSCILLMGLLDQSLYIGKAFEIGCIVLETLDAIFRRVLWNVREERTIKSK